LKIVSEGSGLFEVDAFDDPIRELASFKPNGYDVLVLDVKMGDIDGFKVY
jgi:DNA-binding response OmpR family regulator